MTDAKTNYSEAQVLKWLLTADVTSRPSEWFVGLHTGDPGEDAALNELVGLGYTRITCSFEVTNQTATNTVAVNFGPATGAWGVVSHFSVWDAVAAGNPIYQGALNDTRTVGIDDRLAFDIGSMTVSET
jgi:hypothetical protein